MCVKAKRRCSYCKPNIHGRCRNQPSKAYVPYSTTEDEESDTSLTESSDTSASPQSSRETTPEIQPDQQPHDQMLSVGQVSEGNLTSLPSAVTTPGANTPLEDNTTPEANMTSEANRTPEANMTPVTDFTPAADMTLPEFTKLPDPPIFYWSERDGPSITQDINNAYDEIVHWRRNVFKIPSGKAGKSFVRELTRLFKAYAECSSLEGIALKAAMSLPILILQKPHQNSKTKDHIKCIETRMIKWSAGNIADLLAEGRTIQRNFKMSANKPTSQHLSTTFARLMKEGKVRAALRLLSNHENGAPLSLDSTVGSKTVREILHEKHPSGKPINTSALIHTNSSYDPHPVIYDQISGPLIRTTALHTEGAAGPSNIDAHGWRRLCTAFQDASNDLCEALASVARRICSTLVDPSGLDAFTACRLIALDKNPGVRPIGIGEVSRRIISKAILAVISLEVQDAAGTSQLCAGQQAGCESAIHAMREIFGDDDTQAILLVDASNTFNNLNRQTALLGHLPFPR